jgi:hypothetical protein
MQVPRDGRQQFSAFDVIVGHMDGKWPALESGGWQRVNQDAYVLAPSVRRVAPSAADNSGPPVEVKAEEPARSKARALWPDWN